MFPDGYPTRDEVSDLELYDQFEKEWKKEKAKAPSSPKFKVMPSLDTVLRVVGRRT